MKKLRVKKLSNLVGLIQCHGEGNDTPLQYSCHQAWGCGLSIGKPWRHCWFGSRHPDNVGFPDMSVGKESVCSAGDPSSIAGLEISPGEGKGYPLQYAGLENSRDCIVHGVAKSWTWLSNFHFHHNKVNIDITWTFWFPSAYKSHTDIIL